MRLSTCGRCECEFTAPLDALWDINKGGSASWRSTGTEFFATSSLAASLAVIHNMGRLGSR